jgi:outer membrane translocation and assembly module TamA
VRTGIAYNHRNLFGGAEALRLALNGAYLRTQKDNFAFQDFIVSDASARLSLPRFVFFQPKYWRSFSKTTFSLRHETNWFKYDLPELGPFRMSLQRVTGEAGYSWKNQRSGSVTQEFNPVSLGLQFSTFSKDLVRQKLMEGVPTDTTGTSVSLLSFLEYKPNYTFSLDERLGPSRQLTHYFRLHLAAQLSGYNRNKYLPADYKLASPRNFFIETDYRQYQKTTAHQVLVMRLAIGAGIPLRTGGTIALLDRYIVGGASSVRAFAPRTIGPGTQARDTSRNTVTVSNYTGNLLIESSIEYRIALGRYPELAVFLDAGNIWLTSGPDATKASQFHVNSFYRALAVGSGVGLRINLGFFVLRLDVAFPLSKPYLPTGERWVGDQLRFGSGLWRKENLNWNFSFGLPF